MGINHYIGEIKKGLRAPVYLLYGESHFLLKEAVFLTSGIIPEEKRDFSLNIFDMEEGDRPSIDDIVDILNTMPFFDGKRYVIIENIQSMKKKEIQALTDYISNPSPYSVLVMLHRGKLKDDLKGLFQKVRSIPVDIRVHDIPSWIREKARQKGIDLTDGAVDYLIGITGQDIGLISSEIEKISILGKRQVDANDISAISKDEGDYDVFDLIEAIKRRDRPNAFRILKRILDSTESYNILGALNWYFGRLKEDNKSIDPDRIFHLLHEADSALKLSGGRYPLEYLLIRLLQP
jgi:DNA polymerase-3 subunit delta